MLGIDAAPGSYRLGFEQETMMPDGAEKKTSRGLAPKVTTAVLAAVSGDEKPRISGAFALSDAGFSMMVEERRVGYHRDHRELRR